MMNREVVPGMERVPGLLFCSTKYLYCVKIWYKVE